MKQQWTTWILRSMLWNVRPRVPFAQSLEVLVGFEALWTASLEAGWGPGGTHGGKVLCLTHL